ncbi:cytochrome P450 [Streptomyces sp. NPDC059003]|uniref:cytochrome P450 n=1 Tax=Streptomyces sp. NPDC059003 TaxID=3346691 RepID=UPI0036B9C7CE
MSPFASLPTAPGELPVLGHTIALLRRPLRFLISLPTGGEVVRVRLGRTRIYVVCTPQLTRHVLQNDQVFDKGGPLFERCAEFLGNGLGTCPHRDHRRQRRLLQPVFHRARLPVYAQTMVEQATAVASSWTNGRPTDVLAQTQTIAARTIIATALTGANLSNEDVAVLIADLNTVHRGVLRRMLMPPSMNRLPLFGNPRYDQARARLHTRLAQVVADYRAASTDHGDMLSAMLALDSTRPGSTLSDAEITDQLVTFAFAGTETTASLMAWALYLLAHHPKVQLALQNEVDRVVADAPAANHHLPHLDLLRRIVTETLRMFPPGFLITRTVTRDTRLGSHALPAGATVAYSPYLLHHNPALFPRPEQFDPDRWSSNRGLHSQNDTLIPFASGPRKCIGDAFAIIEATLALTEIISRWHLAPAPGSITRPAIGSTIFPKGLYLTPTARIPDRSAGSSR